ncbi:MAG: serine hydrolase domain-containing protein [Pseudomonadota bacterium]
MTLPKIHGHCADTFAPVKAAFAANFVEKGEVGARVAIIQRGETVVDLWGGHTDASRAQEWQENNLVCTMSVTKGVVALCAHLLASRGQLDYDQPVADYWPEFAAAGKEKITVRQAMSHQASLAIIDDAEPGDAADWLHFASKIAAQGPNWAVCTDETYHSVTIGYITGELVRRIDGRPIEQFIAEELAGPLEADFILGVDAADLGRVVRQINNPANELMNGGLINEQTAAMFAPLPVLKDPHDMVRMVFPSGGGVGHGLSLAKLFAPFANGGTYNGQQLFTPEVIAAASEQQWHHHDSMFGNDFRVALGLLLNIDFNYWGREGNVGTAGAGGYAAFADSENGISYGYTPNRFGTGAGLGEQHRALVDALYQCV